VGFDECQSLTAIREILCVHSSHVDGCIQNEVGTDLEQNAFGIDGGLRTHVDPKNVGISHKTILAGRPITSVCCSLMMVITAKKQMAMLAIPQQTDHVMAVAMLCREIRKTNQY